ncbi:HAD-IIIC family phosphatase [Phenylobacterium sp.]|uniref:HAD-IIIC family phosphatase n=1 Tax=Phenylobacterium sp. TaxID=1871053 RepID=UPI00182F9077|nr:HAD-IIIC family phosphatase [Phenylobacterium sp.]MBA4793718.1 HAD-IIIC family phosphatase [Phenylobacterium sp.]MBC7168848.1 HAD-IIIC family phosphatase [Phenylobacterium sp.]
MKRLVFDLDGTLTIDDPQVDYAERRPNLEVVEKLREYRALGFEIVICSARNMRTFGGQLGKINAHTLPVILDWLARHDVPYDELHVGKPWCGTEGFYIDDKAVRPSEFARLSLQEIADLLAREAGQAR